MAKQRSVSTSRTIAAPAGRIFALLDDPAQHPRIDGSGSVRTVRGGGRHLVLGDRFGMDMRIGLPYRVTNTVVEYELDRLIAWAHFAGHRWRYELEPAGAGSTTVTETFDWSTSKFPPFIELMGFPRKNLRGMEQTLVRLDEAVT